jgi:hypothetical protein
MSRSIRRPYAACTGTNSAKGDKRQAHRGERRAQNLALRTTQDYDNLVLPDRRVCTWGNVWNWGRDGRQHLHFPPDRNRGAQGSYFDEQWFQWQLEYYRGLLRK